MGLNGKINPALDKLEPYTIRSSKVSVKLNQNESPFDLPVEIKERVVQRLLSENWHRYPDVTPFELIEQLSEFHGIDEGNIIVGNGSNELLYEVFMALNVRAGEVLIPVPSFYLFEKVVGILGGCVHRVPVNPDLSFDVDLIMDEASRIKPVAVVICSPSNPTGQVLNYDDLKFLISSIDSIFIVDEAYIDFSSNRSVVDTVDKFENLIVLRTFSKAFGLAGVRIGYAVAGRELAKQIRKVSIPFTVDRFAEISAIEMIKNIDLVRERVRYIVSQRGMLYHLLSGIDGIDVIDTEANFLLVRTDVDAGRMVELLIGEGVLVRDMSSYPMMRNIFRVTIGAEDENRKFFSSFEKILKTNMVG
jgi:histidinol-phosphate aminotransferase